MRAEEGRGKTGERNKSVGQEAAWFVIVFNGLALVESSTSLQVTPEVLRVMGRRAGRSGLCPFGLP